MPLHTANGSIMVANREPMIQSVIIYPVSEDIVPSTEITDDGTSPAYMPASAATTTVSTEGTAVAAWTEDINFEQQGIVTLISFYAEFEWQTSFTSGTGGGTASVSKIQFSVNGGTTWTDLTENYTNTSASMAARIRAGVINIASTIGTGANRLSFRLVHWTNGGGTDTSNAQIRSNSYVRVTYRKS